MQCHCTSTGTGTHSVFYEDTERVSKGGARKPQPNPTTVSTPFVQPELGESLLLHCWPTHGRQGRDRASEARSSPASAELVWQPAEVGRMSLMCCGGGSDDLSPEERAANDVMNKIASQSAKELDKVCNSAL